jgi:pilus assembly protein CpaB
MRRGGRVFLLLGILLIAAVLFGVGYFFLNPGQSALIGQQAGQILPTTVPINKRVVAANIDIPNNTVMSDTETFLRFEEISETEFNANAGQYFTSFAELRDFVTIRTINAREIITRRDVIEAGLSLRIPPARPGQPRPKAIVFEVNNLSGVADLIKAQDYVDILASFDIPRTSIRPSTGFIDPANIEPGQPVPTPGIAFVETEFIEQTTKTLVQNVQVLDIRRPIVVEGTPGPDGQPAPQPAPAGPPQTGPDGQPLPAGQSATGTQPEGTFNPNARWILVLAVTDQQAEVIKFAIEKSKGITLVLRGRGDDAIETTLGTTLDILISRYGMPVPVPVGPAVGPVTQLTPLPATAVPPTVTP